MLRNSPPPERRARQGAGQKLDANSQVTIAPGTEIAVRVTNPGDIGGR